MNVDEYNKCVDLYSDKVFRFILKNIRNREKAEDIIQDTFEKLWINVDNVNFSKAKSYIFTTAYHGMIDIIRKEKKQTDFENIKTTNYAHTNQYNDIKEILDEGLKQLNEIQRSVVLLRDYEGYSYKEIALITNLNESQVKVYIYRARMFLKKYIGELEAVI